MAPQNPRELEPTAEKTVKVLNAQLFLQNFGALQDQTVGSAREVKTDAGSLQTGSPRGWRFRLPCLNVQSGCNNSAS